MTCASENQQPRFFIYIKVFIEEKHSLHLNLNMSIKSGTFGCDVIVDSSLHSRSLNSFCLGLSTKEVQISYLHLHFFRLVNHTLISRQLLDECLAAMFATSLMHSFRDRLVELSRHVVFNRIYDFKRLYLPNRFVTQIYCKKCSYMVIFLKKQSCISACTSNAERVFQLHQLINKQCVNSFR